MVSYPDTVQDRSALVVRAASRAPSVASSSRASTSRRHHRHQRSSQPGGSTYQPQNEFPIFTHTGDVEIIITSSPHVRRTSSSHVGPYANSQAPRREQRYLLHRLILSQASGFFEAGTSEEWSRAQAEIRPPPSSSALARMPAGPAAADEGAKKKRWRYELDWGEHGDEMPMLLQKVCCAIANCLPSDEVHRRLRPRLCRIQSMRRCHHPSTTNRLPRPMDSSGPWQISRV